MGILCIIPVVFLHIWCYLKYIINGEKKDWWYSYGLLITAFWEKEVGEGWGWPWGHGGQQADLDSGTGGLEHRKAMPLLCFCIHLVCVHFLSQLWCYHRYGGSKQHRVVIFQVSGSEIPHKSHQVKVKTQWAVWYSFLKAWGGILAYLPLEASRDFSPGLAHDGTDHGCYALLTLLSPWLQSRKGSQLRAPVLYGDSLNHPREPF